MPRRKRSLDPPEENDEQDRKRKKIQTDLSDTYHELYDVIKSYKNADGRTLSDSFVKAPKRRSSADYYEVVTNPMDLARIQQKIKADEYQDLDQFSADIELMISNAKSYFKKNTTEYKDACELWDAFIDAKNDIEGKDEHHDEESPFEELFGSIMTAVDSEGRNLSDMFKLLPSKEKYPEYYSVIKEPIDLKAIAKTIVDNSYQSLADMEKDFLLMVKNAKTFNEPGSQIYKDSTTLRRVFQTKKTELEQRKSAPAKSSERIRAKRLSAGQKWSVIVSNLNEDGTNMVKAEKDSEHGDDVQEEGEVEETESPLWILYHTVKSHPGPQGSGPLSDPFLRLPNKRFHIDYYEEIERPISLLKIKQKINLNQYSSPMELVDDMNLMFENAKKYNLTDSKIYKDAVKLQKVMQAKARELINTTLGKDSESDEENKLKSRKSRKISLNSSPALSPPPSEPRIERRGRKPLIDTPENLMKKKQRIIYKALLDYTNESGRNLISMFTEKPSKKDYPDYYEVITNPIDMKTIDHNIKADKYPSEETLIADFKLMFSNCQQYNEERSLIYKDSILLEQVLMDKVRDIQKDPNMPRNTLIKRNRLSTGPYLKPKLKNFYEKIRDFTDSRGRKLSTIFIKLPNRAEFPDYYEVIKRPINMEKILQKMKNNQYDGLEDMMADFLLMFDNACKYNEPDSQIYKDALHLQSAVLQTKNEFCQNLDVGIPDVKSNVQEILTNIFISVYRHQDEEGRNHCDSIVELSESDGEQSDGQSKLSLDLIKRKLDKGKYRRLDRFQEHMFEVFENARIRSRTDSQIFEDSIELQTYFIQIRDELCQYGRVLSSPAFAYSQADLQGSIDTLKAEKLPQEQQEADEQSKAEKQQDKSIEDNDSSESMDFKGQTYSVGDFVYVEPREKGMEPHIIYIEKMWKDKHDEDWIFGTWFYRPNETFHLATRKFLEKEVFRSDNRTSTPLNQVIGKCYVMWIKDYFKTQPLGFKEKDVYVCESRYSAKLKCFRVIKQIWPYTTDSNVKFDTRATPLVPVRVPSLFKNAGLDNKSKLSQNELDDNDSSFIDKPRQNVVLENVSNAEEGATYFEQFTIPSGTYKLGDCCYVRTENGKTLIGRIDRMWVKSGNPFFHGPWFVTPQEVQHSPNRLFYKKEVFLSSIQDTNPLLSVKARCSVFDMKDYVITRPTEIDETDVYICESRYLEAERQIRKLNKGLKKFNLGIDTTEDEYFTFKKPIHVEKAMSPLMTRAGFETDNEESSELPPLGSDYLTPHSSRKKMNTSKRLVSGYILFASEVRKRMNISFPDRSFGEVSRLIGNEWRNLPQAAKQDYEERAQKQNEELAALTKEGLDSYPQSPASGENSRTGSERGENTLYECSWNNCDFQFEDMPDLSEHLLAESTGHLYQTFPNPKAEGEYQCYWVNCQRVKKNTPPFPNISRLIRHLREVHFKTASRSIPIENRSRNFFPSQRRVASPAVVSTPMSNGSHFPGLHTPHSPHPGMYPPPPPSSFVPTPPHPHPMYPIHPVSGGYPSPAGPMMMMSRIPEPLFVSAPPRTQRLLHSTTYVKYIEGLQIDNKHISNWDGQLKATKHNTITADARRMPVHWLANGPGNHGNALNALWALRDFMLKDALNVSKIL